MIMTYAFYDTPSLLNGYPSRDDVAICIIGAVVLLPAAGALRPCPRYGNPPVHVIYHIYAYQPSRRHRARGISVINPQYKKMALRYDTFGIFLVGILTLLYAFVAEKVSVKQTTIYSWDGRFGIRFKKEMLLP